ncbi:MAG: trigger factor [Nitriliruptoraceae bacterium]
MKTSVETLEPVKIKLTVQVEPQRVKKAFDRAAKTLAKDVNLPGFRPGKAPRKLLEQRFGVGAIAQAAMEDAISDYYAEALREHAIDPVAQPEVDVEHFDEEHGCSFTAVVEIAPEITAPDHTGIDVAFPEWSVDEAEVDAQLDTLRERFAEVDVVERLAATGDLVSIDLVFAVDGESIESSKVEDALYEVGSAGVTPQLDEKIVGAVGGDTFTYDDVLPAEYPEYGGQTATFTVTVKDVREKTLPALDDDFASAAGGFDSMDELRGDMRNSLLRRQIEEAHHQVRGDVLEAYLARVDVPLPPSMVEYEVEQQLAQLDGQAGQFGIDADVLLEAQGMTRDEFTENARESAETSVKAQLVLNALSQTLSLDFDPREIDREIVRHARINNVTPEEVAKIIQEQGTLPALIGDIMRRKTIDVIVDAATLKGAPDDELLIELGLKAAEVVADADAEGVSGDTEAE